MGEISKLEGLGPKSERQLNSIGIETLAQLKSIGPVEVYIQLQKQFGNSIGLNFLYALVGAIENRHWQDVAKNDKGRLIFELDDYQKQKTP